MVLSVYQNILIKLQFVLNSQKITWVCWRSSVLAHFTIKRRLGLKIPPILQLDIWSGRKIWNIIGSGGRLLKFRLSTWYKKDCKQFLVFMHLECRHRVSCG